MKYLMTIHIADDPEYNIPILLEHIIEVIKADGLGSHVYVEQHETKNRATLKEATNAKNT
jgi:hypothetical protein